MFSSELRSMFRRCVSFPTFSSIILYLFLLIHSNMILSSASFQTTNLLPTSDIAFFYKSHDLPPSFDPPSILGETWTLCDQFMAQNFTVPKHQRFALPTDKCVYVDFPFFQKDTDMELGHPPQSSQSMPASSEEAVKKQLGTPADLHNITPASSNREESKALESETPSSSRNDLGFDDSSSIHPSFAVCMPVIPRDIRLYKFAFQNALLQNEVKPKEILMVLVNFTDHDIVRFQNSLQALQQEKDVFSMAQHSNIQLRFFMSHDLLHPGLVRNFCADMATSDFMAFIDADDLMSHDRLRAAKKAIFMKPSIAIIGHAFAKQSLELYINLPEEAFMLYQRDLINVIYSTRPGAAFQYHLGGFFFHKGHIIVRRSIFRHVRYSNNKRRQDFQFLNCALRGLQESQAKKPFFAGIALPLSAYCWRKFQGRTITKCGKENGGQPFSSL